MSDEFEFLTVRQVVAELAVSKRLVLQWIEAGDLPARRHGNRYEIERGMFERWIQDQYAATRHWLAENPGDGFHGDWQDWPIGRIDDDGRPPTRG